MQIFYTQYANDRKERILNEYSCLANKISSLEKAIKSKPTIVKSELGSILIPDRNEKAEILCRQVSVVLSSKIIFPNMLHIYFIRLGEDIWIMDVIFE